jgi:chromodomain-helicase-DNA-binding protein 7
MVRRIFPPIKMLSRLTLDTKKSGDTAPRLPYYDPIYDLPEKIIGEDDRKYLVKWTNLDYNQCTWETSEFIACPELIKEFRDHNKLPSLQYRLGPAPPDPSEFRPITSHKRSKSGMSMKLYQLAELNFLVNLWYNRRNAILADEMGLGKTLQALSFLEYLSEKEAIHGPFFVIAPLSTISHWEREVAEWTDMYCLAFFGSKARRRLMRDYDFYYNETMAPKFHLSITTYEFAMKESDLLISFIWLCVIVDEAHHLKNDKSKLFSTMRKFDRDFKVLMTGTPLQNNTENL